MAMNLENKHMDSSSPDNEVPTGFGTGAYYNGFAPDSTDPEKNALPGGQGKSTSRKMSRIGPPLSQSIPAKSASVPELTGDDASDPSIAIGKQIEMEAGNAIRYRTCSWQKLRFIFESWRKV